MNVFEYLNELAAGGTLGALVQAGVVTARAYGYREIYRQYLTLGEVPRYIGKPEELARVTADECHVDRATVYRALAAMRLAVAPVKPVAKYRD